MFYFSMWDESDRIGYKRFFNYDVGNNLFIIPSVGQKGTVWYSQSDLAAQNRLLQEHILDEKFQADIIDTLDTNWIKLKPYLTHGQITSINEFSDYYHLLVEWWSAMNIVLSVPDMDSAPVDFRQKVLTRRTESERYTDKADQIFIQFWNKQAPQFNDLALFIRFDEALQIFNNAISSEDLKLVQDRVRGCFVHNTKIYPLQILDKVLSSNDLVFENLTQENVLEVKGTTAQPGKITGPVKIVHVKADISKVLPGDILVTAMTSPEYIPYMKIVAGIVTDEGGTTCHAAIVSRELKIPCIVGTKIATKILKNGMQVEVDATNGTVTIIK